MEFLNVGGGELLVIILLALVLFGPEDIARLMRRVGKYAKAARGFWDQFRNSVQQEIPDGLTDEVKEVKQVAEDAVAVLKETQSDLTTTTSEATVAINEASKALESNVHDIEHALESRKDHKTASLHPLDAVSEAAPQSPQPTRPSSETSPIEATAQPIPPDEVSESSISLTDQTQTGPQTSVQVSDSAEAAESLAEDAISDSVMAATNSSITSEANEKDE